MGYLNFFRGLILVLLVHGYRSQIDDSELVIDHPTLGSIRGGRGRTAADGGINRDYVQFRGIPFATFPNRFSPSELVETVLAPGDTFNATTNPLQCFQPLSIEFFLTEQCLTINVYTHKKHDGDDANLRPVLFFIHGGAFTVGAGASFSGLRLMNRDIVYVSFNYRLGLMGFFSLQNEDVPGNAGMYDVVNALKWTKNNIRAFGGNPDLITIAGQSAGAVTVTHLLASPMARGLFHRAIAASGSALNAWGTSTDPMTDSLNIANRCGCYNPVTSPIPNKAQIAQCMRKVPPMILVNSTFDYQVAERNAGRLGFAVVSPVVQDFPMITHSKFLPEHPRKVFEEGRQEKVPLLMGTTKHDGSYVLGVVYNRLIKDNGLVDDEDFMRNKLISMVLNALGILDLPSGIHDTIAKNYLGDARHSGNFMEMYPGLMDVFSVFFFKGDCYQTALMHSNTSDTYWYSFDFRGNVSLFGSLFGADVPPFKGGVTHTDDLIYVYSLTFLEFSETEASISSRMLNYWADFALTGNPTPPISSGSGRQSGTTWPKLDSSGKKYLMIDTEVIEGTEYPDSWVGPGLETVPEPEQSSPSTSATPIRVSSTTPNPNTVPPRTSTEGSNSDPTTTEENSAPGLKITSITLFFVFCVVFWG